MDNFSPEVRVFHLYLMRLSLRDHLFELNLLLFSSLGRSIRSRRRPASLVVLRFRTGQG